MSFEELRNRVELIEGDRADEIRRAFIHRFVDTQSTYYRQRIALREQFKDGVYQTGYLWDCIKNRKRINEDDLWEESLFETKVFVLWDALSSEQVRLPDYWKFPKLAIIKAEYQDVLGGRVYFPDDLYILNEDMSHCVVLTHETECDNELYFFCASPIEDEPPKRSE